VSNDDFSKSPNFRGKSAELESISHRPRYCNIVVFITVVCSISLNTNYISSELTQIKDLLEVKLNWDEETGSRNYEFLQAIFYVGACIGALIAGRIIVYGRRKALWYTLIILAVYGLLTQIMNFWAILFARLIAGFG